jgi:hypothetical protein
VKAKIAIVVNPAGYPKGSPEDQRQHVATNSVLNSPSNVFELFVTLPCEVVQGYTNALELERCACKEIGGARHLPFLKEMLDNLHEQYPDSDYFGFLNSDIIAMDRLWERIDELYQERDCKMFFIRRCDIATGELHRDGFDGLFVHRRLIDFYLDRSPDWVLGEPCWDTGSKWWFRLLGVYPRVLEDGEALHVGHEKRWIDRDTPTFRHNETRYNRIIKRSRMVR